MEIATAVVLTTDEATTVVLITDAVVETAAIAVFGMAVATSEAPAGGTWTVFEVHRT